MKAVVDSGDQRLRQRKWIRRVLHVILWCSQPAVALFEFPFRLWAHNARMAILFWRLDPVRGRAYCTVLFHLAQMCVWALFSSVGLFAIAFVSGFVVPPNLAGQAMIALFLAGKVAIVCAWPLTLAALICSLLCRRKIWIDFAVTPEIVLAGCWPPVIDHKENGAWNAVAFPAIMASFLVGLGLEPFGLAVCIGGAMATLIPLFLLGALAVAHTPADCYPEATSPFSTR